MSLRSTIAQVDLLTITGIEGEPTLKVVFENTAPNRGAVTIYTAKRAWTHYWTGMCGKTVEDFFRDANQDYLVDRYYGAAPKDVPDLIAIKFAMKSQLLSRRVKRLLTKTFARELFDRMECATDLLDDSDLLSMFFGEDWRKSLPMAHSGEFVELHTVIARVQSVLKLSPGADDE